jgi:transcriptional regulator with XRE-family HTH domain
MSEFNVIDHLLERGFKTQARLAAAAGVKQSSVADWKAANRVPFERTKQIIRYAHDEGIEISPLDFYEPELRGSGA